MSSQVSLTVPQSTAVAKAAQGGNYPKFVSWVAKHKKSSRGSAVKMAARLWKLGHAKKRSSGKRGKRGSRRR